MTHTPILTSFLETVTDSAKHGRISWHSQAPRHRLSGRIFNCLNRILLSGTDTEWWTDSESAVTLGLTKDQYGLSRTILTSADGATIAIPVFSVPADLIPVLPDIPLSGEEIIESLNLKISSGASELPRYLHSSGTVEVPVSAPAGSLPMDACLLSCIRYVISVMPDELHDHLLTPVTEDLALWQMLALTGSQRSYEADDEALCCLLADLSLTDNMQKRFIRAILRAEECIRILINAGKTEVMKKVLPEDVTFILTERDRRTFEELLSGTHTSLRQKKQIEKQLKRLSSMLLSGRILRYRMPAGNSCIEFYVTGYKNGIFTGQMTINGGTTYFGESLDYTQMRNFELDLSWEPPETPRN